MNNYEYKVVNMGNMIVLDKKSNITAGEHFQDVINREASLGWKFHSVETITQANKAGCLGNIDDKSRVTYYMIVFERERQS
ncbi:DUF4177 domain-containing protein [Erysipelothrix aquatica]|uniref:DUF4177 domain-containing protein n=1 Tax=Erysipelothrix aquatica TaxID=2683714 RepID=UPI00135968FD|nr:DUF4177 domain-containing protein [Erysipelothrix aquatica]